jgi:ketosteroid isomerase-like protein
LQQDPPGSTKPGAVSEILALEKALYRAMIDRDFETLRDLLSDDLSYMHSTGVAESKAQYLAGVADGLYEYERIESHDVNLHIHLETAVITGQVVMSVSAAGEPKSTIRLLFTLVWTKQTGRWRLLLRQATRIPEK